MKDENKWPLIVATIDADWKQVERTSGIQDGLERNCAVCGGGGGGDD